MSLKGHLGTIALPELLQWLAIGQKTGTLVISEGADVHRVVVDRGRIVSTATSRKNLQLGRSLRAAGLVDEETLERALKLRQATGMSIGRVLLTLQAVEEEDLRAALRDKAEALISILFHSSDATFQFVEDGDLGDPGVALSLDATQLVLSAAHNLERPAQSEAPPGAGDERRGSAAGATVPSSPRPSVRQPTATVIEAFPEDGEPVFQAHEKRRRAWGGLAAAAALVAAVGAVLIIGRSHVPAKAEEAAESAAAVAPGIAARAASGVGAAASFEPAAEPSPAAPRRQDPVPPPITDPPPVDDRRMEELLAEREAELKEQYRDEMDELRRQLEAAQTATVSDPDPAADDGRDRGPATAAEAALEAALEAAPEAMDLPIPSQPLELDAAADPSAAVEAASPRSGVAAGTPPGLANDDAPAALDGAGSPAVELVEEVAASAPVMTPARLLSRPMPTYPAAARRLGREARVTLRALVGVDGKVTEIETTGPRAGLGFDEAARAAARLSRWQPASRDGAPAASWVDLRFDFELP